MGTENKDKSAEGSKDHVIRARVDSNTIDKLNYCVDQLKSNRSEVIRKGIDGIYSTLKEQK